MPASFRRRFRRQYLGARKRSSTIRWRLTIPWGDRGTVSVDKQVCKSLKADKGAEKSLRRKRRSKRGRRRGKQRSRGRHPRSQPAQTANVYNNTDRTVKHKLRMLEFHRKVGEDVKQRFRILVEKRLLVPAKGIGWKRYQAQWDRIHTWARLRDRLSADAVFGHSFVDFLEYRIDVKVYSRSGVLNSRDSLFGAMMNLPRRGSVGENNHQQGGLASRSPEQRTGNISILPGRSTKFCRGCGSRIPRDQFPCYTCHERQHGVRHPSDRGVSVMTIRDLGRAYRVHRP